MKGCRDSMERGHYDKPIPFAEEVLQSSGGNPIGPSMRKTGPNGSSVLEPLRGNPKGRPHPLFPMSMLVEDRRPQRRSRPFEPKDRLRVVAQHVAAELQAEVRLAAPRLPMEEGDASLLDSPAQEVVQGSAAQGHRHLRGQSPGAH